MECIQKDSDSVDAVCAKLKICVDRDLQINAVSVLVVVAPTTTLAASDCMPAVIDLMRSLLLTDSPVLRISAASCIDLMLGQALSHTYVASACLKIKMVEFIFESLSRLTDMVSPNVLAEVGVLIKVYTSTSIHFKLVPSQPIPQLLCF